MVDDNNRQRGFDLSKAFFEMMEATEQQTATVITAGLDEELDEEPEAETVISYDDIKGSTIYDIWKGEDGYIHFRAITPDGKGLQFNLPWIYDREDNELDDTKLPRFPLGDARRT